jgi:hypothetical protein
MSQNALFENIINLAKKINKNRFIIDFILITQHF